MKSEDLVRQQSWSAGQQSAASRSGWPSACSFWRLVPPGGWEATLLFGSGQAEFGGPALDVRPEPAVLVQVFLAGDRSSRSRCDRPACRFGETARFNAELGARSRCLRLQSGGRVEREASCPGRVQETLVIGHEGG